MTKYKLLVRESVNKHVILKSILSSLDSRGLSIYDLRKTSNLFKLKISQSDILIFTDPIVFMMVYIGHFLFIKRFPRMIFISLEMYEFQRDSIGFFSRIRNKVFELSHRFSLKRTDVIFPNKARSDFYKRKFQSLNLLGILENSPSKQSIDICEDIKKIPREKVIDDLLNQEEQLKILGKNIYVYSGAFNLTNRSLDTIFKAFKNVEHSVLIIAGRDNDAVFTRPNRFKNVIYLGERTHLDVFKLYRISNYGIAFYSNENMNTKYAAPVKIYEYKLFGLGVICNDNIGVKSIWNHSISYYNNEKELVGIINNNFLNPIHNEIEEYIPELTYENKFLKLISNES